jgi:ABC-type dipeptide/oligopeptide/nickel transport system permease component
MNGPRERSGIVAERFAVFSRVARAAVDRVFGAGFVLLVLASLVFASLRLLPGDPTSLVLGEQAPESERALLRARLGLDAPLSTQYVTFVAGLATLDLGDSLSRPGVPAFAEVGRALGPTSALAAVAVALGAFGGIAVALLATGPWLARRREWVHRAILAVAATPLVAVAPAVTYLVAVKYRIVPLPGDPESGALGLFFASALLATPLGAQVARIARAALLDQRHAKYLEVARAKGASELRVFVVHALPVASGPIAVVVASQLGALLGGAVVLERLFERPGLGTLMLNAYASRDIPVLEAAVVAAGGLFILAQAGAAAATAIVDPRGQTT